jgi:hypothetical protein
LPHFTISAFAMPAATLQSYIDAGNTSGLAAVFAGDDTFRAASSTTC